jgi:2-polyprenyl-3-methyl-5-hydroxy-6-metoxy-1,4-benzoquinol methylase
MKTASTKYDYVYSNSRSQHHHAYITPPLLAFLQQSSPSNGDKPHVLDLGCGNGSLSYVINQAGY